MTAETIVLTDDERALILALREIEARPGAPIPDSIRERRGVWFSLIEARAMLYRDAIRFSLNDLGDRRDRMLNLVTPTDLIDLVRGWRALQRRLDDEERREMDAAE